jgi:hypothetical protein
MGDTGLEPVSLVLVLCDKPLHTWPTYATQRALCRVEALHRYCGVLRSGAAMSKTIAFVAGSTLRLVSRAQKSNVLREDDCFKFQNRSTDLAHEAISLDADRLRERVQLRDLRVVRARRSGLA